MYKNEKLTRMLMILTFFKFKSVINPFASSILLPMGFTTSILELSPETDTWRFFMLSSIVSFCGDGFSCFRGIFTDIKFTLFVSIDVLTKFSIFDISPFLTSNTLPDPNDAILS